MRLDLYTVHHLNLAYSSLEEERRAEVIAACYWPLLRLAKRLRVPIGLEAPAYTLECIEQIDPEWIAELRRLMADGLCEFVASGYSQLIGPLVPAAVTQANLRIGLAVYERLLGLRPRLALINEQAYSGGLVALYRDAGFDGIVMEWENAASAHADWPRDFQYAPQTAVGCDGATIPLLWNHSITFQQFQRYAHNDSDLQTFVGHLAQHVSGDARAMCLYGNDVEVFDFRPGRYRTEAVQEHGEWDRIGALYSALLADARFRLRLPGDVLRDRGPGQPLRLETSAAPVPVKKQNKYNITRWAVTGRDDLGINTACWQVYESLRRDGATEDRWRELCYLWSSDFRTHITEKRWAAYRERLALALGRSGVMTSPLWANSGTDVREGEREIPLVGDTVRLKANRRRGLAVEEVVFAAVDARPLCGTLPHGYYSDIKWAADFYTGNLVLESPGAHKVTDLEPAQNVRLTTAPQETVLSGTIPTQLGDIDKRIVVSRHEPEIRIEYRLRWKTIPIGSLRLGFVLLNPETFDYTSLFVRTHNGGETPETFALQSAVDHGAPVSHLVSARYALGVTEGWLEVGDATRILRITVEKNTAALVAMVTCERVGGSYVCRVEFSAAEVDDTRKATEVEPDGRRFALKISAARVG